MATTKCSEAQKNMDEKRIKQMFRCHKKTEYESQKLTKPSKIKYLRLMDQVNHILDTHWYRESSLKISYVYLK